MSAQKVTITGYQTIVGNTPADLDRNVLAALQAGAFLYGQPYVTVAGICQPMITKTVEITPDTIAALKAQGVAEALDAGTVITPQDKAAADAQAVAEAIAGGQVVEAAKVQAQLQSAQIKP
jgi:hypothetical protein